MTAMEYRSIGARLRPPRFVVGYRPGQDWIHTARRVVAATYRLWGGNGAVIAPVGESGTMEEIFACFMRTYDPDHVAVYVPFIDATHDDPALFNKIAEERIRRGEDRAAVWTQLSVTQRQAGEWDALAEQANSYCSPFKYFIPGTREFGPVDINFIYHTYSSEGLLPTVSAAPERRIYTLDLSRVDQAISLMVETRIGSVDPASDEKRDIIKLPVADEDLPRLLRLAITGKIRPETWNLEADYPPAGKMIGASDPDLTVDKFLAETPFAQSGQSTIKTMSYSPAPPVVCVVGETAEDHALGLLCDRLFLHSAWVPTHLLAKDEPLRPAVMSSLHQLRYLAVTTNRPMLITSISEPSTIMETLTADLISTSEAYTEDVWPIPSLEAPASTTPITLTTERGRCVLGDPVAFSVRRRVPVADDAGDISMLTPIALPMPRIVEHQGSRLCWYVDIWMRGHRLPGRTSLPGECLQNSPYGPADTLVRMSLDGLTFASQNIDAVIGHTSPELRIAQPLLRFPSADVVFTELAAAAEAQVERSSAGRRSAIAVEMWGSFQAVASDLVGPIRELLNAFIPPRAVQGDYGIGYEIRGNGYVALEDAANLLGVDRHEARDTIDRLLALKALSQGFLLYCARCRSYAFYRIDQVGSTFECHACGHVSPLLRSQWYAKDPEPHWYYSLDQVVRDLLTSHGDVPLLAAAELSKQSSSVLWSPELELRHSNGSIELDICLVIDGRIVVGEAKSNSALGGDKGTQEVARRLARAAQILTADEIILATTQSTWAKNTLKTVQDEVFKSWTRGPRPLILERTKVGA